ncbi:MAG: hypothetical protein ACM359_19870 [Bacillota bacterium]
MLNRCLLAALVMVLLSTSVSAKKVLRLAGGGENRLASPRAYEKGFEQDGDVFRCENADAAAARGVAYHVVLNQDRPYPLVASAMSKAENVTGGNNPDYALYLDLIYTDGSHLWGQAAAFDVGTHDWQERRVRIMPEKPVKEVSFYLLFRQHAGKAFFRDPRLVQLTPPQGATLFDGTPVELSPGRTGFSVRDVAADSDFVPFENGQSLGLNLDVQTNEQALASGLRATFHSVRLSNPGDTDRVVTLLYTLHLPGSGYRWLGDCRREEPVESPRDYRTLANSRLSRYPLAAVAKDQGGQAIGLDLGHPAVFRVGYNAGFSELYIAFDVALVPEKKSAELRFCTFSFDATWGSRGAVAGLYELFPEYFRCRIPDQGIWMPFHAISKVDYPEDFGFKFKEGNDQVAWDDAHNVLTFRYTEPMTWWMAMPKEMPRTLDAAVAHAKELASQGNRNARALLSSGHHDEQGRLVAQILDTPWCNGAVWSMNSAPGIAGDVTDFKEKWNGNLRAKLYPNAAPDRQRVGLDGEYIDSSEGYVTAVFDYRRDHFAAMRTPLTFSTDSHRPAIYRGLIAYEYIRGIAEDVHGMGRFMMANSTPDQLCWLAPLLDVLGTETDWNPNKRWQPMTDGDLLYRRVLCGQKPYCFLMNTVFDNFPYELTEKYFKRSLAYGMFPGFFSHNAAEGHYFSRPELYNRDRALFKKYIPLCKRVAEAGWQPITLARSSESHVHVERFGRQFLTVFNDSSEPRSVTITLEGMTCREAAELVSGARISWQDGKAEIKVGAEDVAVLELQQ